MKLSEKMRKRNAGLNNAFEYADEVAQLEAHFMVQIKALMENRERWHQRWKIAHDILNTTQRKQYEEELDTLTGGADWFCPACDAGAGHCNGPHDEIPF